ncbi:hypothetical protein [Brevundimonas sp.]|uniref:hypothetical protein n=1 Tax=Brevundimonas sp. TaxID=1871086 RepID=UPI002D13A7EF|nr:hypothetical protein [Brevundimonas sp.]HWQ85870.1 hypothetical protein [Brevundimonas sp.]
METIAAAATKTVEPVKPTEYERPCEPGQDRRGSDLCAQWKAADGATSGAEWAKWQTILSGFGLAGLIYSLHLTRKAVRAATEATDDAETALKIAAQNAAAATKMAEVTAEHGKLQNEAGFHFVHANMTVLFDEILIAFTLKNVRPTAAVSVGGDATFTFTIPDQPPVTATVPLLVGNTEVHEGAETGLYARWEKISEAVKEQILASTSFEISARYWWNTVFHERLERTVTIVPRNPQPFAFGGGPVPPNPNFINVMQTSTTATRTKLGGEG